MSSNPERPLVGLCVDCTWLRRVTSSRERVFYLCGRSFIDSRFAKYPVLPVEACAGFRAVESSQPSSTR